jgi:pilus assembly protein CpaB
MAIKLPSLAINRTWLMLAAAIGLALLATVLTTQYLKSREASIAEEVKARAQQGGPKITVTVPTRDMPIGTPLGDNVVAARDVPADLVYPDVILADDFDKYKGQSLIRPVLKGRPLMKGDLRPMAGDFSGSLPDGRRAITIDVDELNSIAHMVVPGNRVDLMLVMRRDDGGQTVMPFMDRMKVLATGQRTVHDGGDEGKSPGQRKTTTYATLTLDVAPTQAARLTLAQELGRLRFVLRNEKDVQSEDFSVNAQNILDEITARARNNKKQAMEGTVEFIVGGQRAANGTNTKSLDVSVPGSAPKLPGMVPALSPAGANSGASSAASSGANAGTPGVADANGLTPEIKAEIKSLLQN